MAITKLVSTVWLGILRFVNCYPACFLVLSFAFLTPSFGQSRPLVDPKALKIRFEGDFDRFGNSFLGPDAALAYEVVRSKQASSVQWTMKWFDGNQTPAIPRSITFDFYAVDDFAACASLAPLSYKEFISDTGRKDDTPKLFDVSTYDHELIQGHCVASKLAIEVPASHTVAVNSSQITVTNGDRQRQFSKWSRYDALAALGINIASSGHDLWSRDGMTKSLDPLSDAELIRAIRASAPMRLAALRVLAHRVTQPVTRECWLAHSIPPRPVGPAVVQAILDKNTLSEANSELRLQGMRALATIRPATSHPQLVAQLISGLEQPIEDFRPPAEVARQNRVKSLLGAATSSEGQQTFRDKRHFEVAAALALASGDDVTNDLALRYEDYLRNQVLGSLADQPCTDELVAKSPYGAEVTIDLIRKVDSEKFAIPDIQRRIQSMAAIAAQNSPQMKSVIMERCNRTGGFLPNGEPKQAAAFCQITAH